MAQSGHSCHDSDGLYCGTYQGSFTDASCCSQFVETYTPRNGMPRTRCIGGSTQGQGLGDGIEIAVMTGADGSKSLDKLQEGMSETMKGLLGLTIVIGSIYFLTGLKK